MKMNNKLYKHMPGKARIACVLLTIIGALTGLGFLFGLYITIFFGLDNVREYLTLFTLYLSTVSFIAAKMLSNKNPKGRIAAWFVLPFILLASPLMTVLGVFTIIYMYSKDMKNYLIS